MTTRDQASAELARSLSRALGALADQLETPDDAHLESLDVAINDMLAIHRTVSADVRSAKVRKMFTAADAGRIFRVMIVFSTLIDLVSNDLKTGTGKPWGAHLFSPHDFDEVGYDAFARPSNEQGVRRMLQDQARDMIEAGTDLMKMPKATHAVYTLAGAMDVAVERICAAYGCSPAPKLAIDLLTVEEVQAELGLGTAAEVEALVEQRMIMSVNTWSLDQLYPAFQFYNGAVRPAIAHAIQNVAPGFEGWPLAVFLFNHQTENKAFFEEKLAPRGQWRPSWSKAATNVFKDVTGTPGWTVESGETLYRIARTGYSPFFFRSLQKTGAAKVSSGRFDLHPDTKKGTVYISTTERGAWREVLDREPVVTLRSLLGRTLWELHPQRDIEIAEIAIGAVDISASRIRKDTQDLAMRLSNTYPGVHYRLRSDTEGFGIALFGDSGATLPAATHLGVWGSEPKDGLHHAGLWEYLDFRENNESAFPVLLRRFPSEIEAKALVTAAVA